MASQPSFHTVVSPVAPARRARITQAVGAFFLDSWALIITTFFGLVFLAALSVPLLTFWNLDAIAKPIFFVLGKLCEQIPAHSFYIEGHQVGICVHCLAIYGSLWAGGLFFVGSKKRLRGFPWWVFVLMALPLAYDGFSQYAGLRESTWEIRLLTGALFGLGAAWFTLPMLQRELNEMTSPEE